ncbi:MAG TPA: wax ester/triacylglycerol synthase family O-acyltransferase [Pseudonocardiaceae bacterium]
MAMMPVTDSMFLFAESREHPMHVGGLQIFRLPDGAGPDYLSEVHRRLVAEDDVRGLFRRRPRGPVASLGQWAWANDDQLDLEYHVRLSALPRPGRVRELLELTSRLHGSLLDRHRPLWEFHLIEGLDNGRFATYSKIHHALVDGVSALRLLERSLSTTPDEDLRVPWSGTDRATGPRRQAGTVDALKAAVRAMGDLAGLGPQFVRIANQALREQASATLPFQAPRSILNVPITGARRFAAQSWPMERVQAVGRATGTTLNDVVLALCSGALRQYLLDLGALPDRSLVAAVPVSLRRDESASGNAVGMTLCTLGTDLADPEDRLRAVHDSMTRGKAVYAGMTPLQVLAVSALAIAPLALTPIPGVVQVSPPPFNLIISNVPGPRQPLYWNGARLEGMYPVSIPYEGQALNITVTSYAGSLEFGLTGCRRSVPSLQRMLTHLDTALDELEKLV